MEYVQIVDTSVSGRYPFLTRIEALALGAAAGFWAFVYVAQQNLHHIFFVAAVAGGFAVMWLYYKMWVVLAKYAPPVFFLLALAAIGAWGTVGYFLGYACSGHDVVWGCFGAAVVGLVALSDRRHMFRHKGEWA